MEPLESRRLLTITVDTIIDELDGSIADGDISLRDAIALAPAGETIDFALSLDGGTILLLLGELDVNDSLTIDASGLPGGLTIDASTSDPTPGVPQGDGIRVFNIDDGNPSNHLDVLLRGLTITGGDTPEAGGGIRSAENLTVDDSLITGNLTANNIDCNNGGGGIHVEGQTTIITSTTISDNTSVVCPGGGMSVITSGSDSTTTISDSTFSGNSVLFFSSGGGIFAFTDSGGTLSISNSTFTDNSDDGAGSAIFAVAIGNGSENEITSSGFTGSLDSIQVETWAGATTVISQIDSGRGIAVYTEGNSTTTISESDVGFISSNTMDGGNTTISHTVVQDGISASTQENGTTTITSSTVSGSQGIGITSETYGSGAQTTIDSSTITGNLGGGIFAETSDGGTTTIVNSTISGNSSNLRSGGVYSYIDGGVLEIKHSTIVGNVADADYDGSGSGGGIFSDGPDPPVLDHTIVAGNVRATGASTSVAEDIVGTVDGSSAYNLVGVDTGLAGIGNGDNGNQVGTAATPLNAKLGPLKNNGGPSHTHVVLSGSPAMDTGDPAFVPPPDVDQRGHPRVVDGNDNATDRIDLGAFEKDTLLGDMDRNGIFDLDDVSFYVLALNDAAQYELDFGVVASLHGDIDQDGDLDLDDVDPFVDLLTGPGAGGSGSGLPTTITVNTLLDTIDGNIADGVISLRDAITVAASGDLIDFDPSLDGGTITLTFGELEIDESLSIDASGLPTGLTVDASGNDPTPTIDNGDGSRVLAISDNNFSTHIDVEIRGLTLTGGDTDLLGGGISSVENLTITDTVITGNSAFDAGGGIVLYNFGVSASIDSSTISGNSLVTVGQTYPGGAGVFAFNYGSNGSTTITSSTISGNSASSPITNPIGGGVWARLGDGAGLFITSSTISGNSHGAGIDVLAYYGTGNTTIISSSTVSGNTGGVVGGVSASARNGDTTTIESTTVANNSGFAVGGVATTTGIGSTTTIDSSTISGNSGNSIGGVSATNDGGGSTAIRSSTISGNAGDFIGGVRANNDGGDWQIRHSTVAGNVADADYSGSGSGGGIFIDGPDSSTLYHTLVAGNVRATGPSSSIADDVFGSVDPASAFNLVGVDTGMTGISDGTGGNQVGTAALPLDARLGPLKNNGGPTHTHVVLAGSPALDTGAPDFTAPPDFDQRGHARVVDGNSDSTARIDIGAFEKDTLLGDMNLDGRRDLDDVDFFVLGLSAPEQYELDVGIAPSLHGDIDQDGDIDLDDVDPYVDLLIGAGGGSTTADGGGAGVPATITVDTLLDEMDGSILDGDVSLRDALAAAPGGATIDFDPSLDGGTVLLTLGELTINDSLNIDAGGLPGGLTIDASGNDPTPVVNQGDGSRVFNLDDGSDATQIDVSILGLTLTGGDVATVGGAIRSLENLTVARSTLTGNAAGLGRVCDTECGGGALFASGGNTTVTSSTLDGNTAYLGGAILAHARGDRTTTISGSTISGNAAQLGGGGILTQTDDGGTTIVSGSTLSGNSSVVGGAISTATYGTGSTTSITDTVVTNNASEVSAVRTRSGYGGTTTIAFVTITAASTGGGIAATTSENGTTTIHSSTVADNPGVGIATETTNAGAVTTIRSSTVSGNLDTGIFATTYDGGSTTIESSTISGNRSDQDGGGLYAYTDNATLVLRHSTIVGNVSDANYDGSGTGGGIFSDGPDAPTLDHTIVARNRRATGPQSSIHDDIAGPLDSASSFNLVGVDTGLAGVSGGTNGNQIGTAGNPLDPRLGPLTNNGGPTETHVPLAGSPALDAGDPSFSPPPDVDQRGAPRVVAWFQNPVAESTGPIDVGAVEKDHGLGDMDIDGDLDLDDIPFFVLGLANPPEYEAQFGVASSLFGDIDQDGDHDLDDVDDFLTLLTDGHGSGTAGSQQTNETRQEVNWTSLRSPNGSKDSLDAALSELTDWRVDDFVEKIARSGFIV